MGSARLLWSELKNVVFDLIGSGRKNAPSIWKVLSCILIAKNFRTQNITFDLIASSIYCARLHIVRTFFFDLISSSMCCNIFNCHNRIQNMISYDVIVSVRTQNVIFDLIQVLLSVLIYIFDLIGSSIYCARLHTVRTPNVFFWSDKLLYVL